jgi:serine/threonine protein kinase
MTRLFAATSSRGLSQTPYVRSTYLSLAPEQWDGKAVPASDQYALAILAFHLLTGQFPFQGSLSQVIHHHYKTPPPPPSSLNPQLDSSIDKIIQRALAKEPAERFPSIQDFAHAFASLLRPADDQIRHVSRALPAQTLSESADTPPPEPSPTELPVSTEAPALIETNEEIQVDKANLALVSTIPPTTPAVAGTLYPDLGISKPAPPLPILRLDPPSPQLSSPPVQRRDHFTMRQSLPIVLLVLVILASSGIFFRNVMARANSSAYGSSNHGARTNAATQSGQTLAGSGGAQPISTPGTSTPISIAGPTPTPVPTSPSGAIPPAGATPPAPGTTPAPASTPQPGSTPQPTATPKTTYPHVPFAVSSSYGRTSGAINFYNRSVQIAGTVSANQASDCARVDFFVYADYGKLLLSSAQTPTNNQVSGGYTCKSFSFNFTLSANVAGGASYVKIDLYFSKNGLVASNNCYR